MMAGWSCKAQSTYQNAKIQKIFEYSNETVIFFHFLQKKYTNYFQTADFSSKLLPFYRKIFYS